MSTVQAPHWPSPQPYFAPVSPSRSRRTNSSDSSDPASTVCVVPFTVREMPAICRLWHLADVPTSSLPRGGSEHLDDGVERRLRPAVASPEEGIVHALGDGKIVQPG